MKIDIQDRRRVLARSFFIDNEDTYENFQEALDEMSEASDSFVEFSTSWIEKQNLPGHRILMHKESGHVIRIREADSFLEPLTLMTEEEGVLLHKEFLKTSEENPKVTSEIVLFQFINWKLL